MNTREHEAKYFPNPMQILIVEDEESLRNLLSQLLSEKCCEPQTAATAEEALALLEKHNFDVALLDIRLPGMNGMELLSRIKSASPGTEVVIMTSHASLETAIEAIHKEAYDYLIKPFDDIEEVWLTVRRAFEKRRLIRKNQILLQDLMERNSELKSAVKRLTSLNAAGRAMSAIYEISELLDFFVGLLVRELRVKRASLMLLDEVEGEMRIAASRGIRAEIVNEVRVKLGDGIAGWVAQTGKPILVRDVHTDPRIKNQVRPHLSDSFISAPITLSVPIMFHDNVLGVINVTNRTTEEPFDDGDVAFLHGLAGQVAVALKRATYYEKLQDAYKSLKTTQDQLVATERLKALGQMAAGVAHDFNNVLNGTLGRAQLLQMHLEGSELDLTFVREELGIIEQISSQGAETVRRIQDFTKIRKDLPSESVDINGVVRNAVDLTRSKWKDECEAQGIQIEVDLELEDLPETAGNSHELSQAISNMIFNAVEAMPDGGTVTFKTVQAQDWIDLTVTDTGLGMSEEVRQQIFEPFFTTKRNGQGLGMSVIHGIISRYGGELRVSSQVGSGTTFYVKLPILNPARKPVRTEAPEARNTGPKRVLIIEDEEMNRRLYERALTADGYEVHLAPSGMEALALFDKSDFDLVITDLSMPGMSGWDVARALKQRRPSIPIILLSGWAIQQSEATLKEAGIDRVLAKPCTLKELKEAIGMVSACTASDGTRQGKVFD